MSWAIRHFLDVYGEGAFDVTIEIYAHFLQTHMFLASFPGSRI